MLNTFPGAEHAAANQQTGSLPTEGLKEKDADCMTDFSIRVWSFLLNPWGKLRKTCIDRQKVV